MPGSQLATNVASERSCLEFSLGSSYLQQYHEASKVKLHKIYTLDASDLNSMAKARQINLQINHCPHGILRIQQKFYFSLFIMCFLCSSLVNTVYSYNCHSIWSVISVVSIVGLYNHLSNVLCTYKTRQTIANSVVESKCCKCMLCAWLGHQIIVSVVT